MSLQLSDEFTLTLPVEEAWLVLTDVTRLAPCMPGAFITSVNGHEFEGGLTLRVGPIKASYGGRARFTELDESRHRATLVGEGREAKGRGGASLSLVVTLMPAGPAVTHVHVETDLSISGRLAQFGHGAVADISSRMLAQFVANLERELAGEASLTGAASLTGSRDRTGSGAVPTHTDRGNPPPEPVDVAAADWPDDDRPRSSASSSDPAPPGPVASGSPSNALDLASIIRPQLHRLRYPVSVTTAFGAGLVLGRRWRTRKARA